MKFIHLILCVSLLIACKKDKEASIKENKLEETQNDFKTKTDIKALGTYAFSTAEDIETTYKKLKSILTQNKNVGIVAELNHTKNAKSVGINLNPTQAIFFGNPKLGTPLMQVNPLTGLDLPQKMLFLENERSNQIVYNDMAYLNQRYALDNHPNLTTINNTLESLVKKISGASSVEHKAFEISENQGIITKKSAQDFDTTLDKLMSLLQNHEALKVIATLDHQANAKKVDMELAPSFLVVFGNPKMGSPLMQTTQSIALDLPQKMLVWENANGDVFVSYNNIYFIQERYQLKGHEDILKNISSALDKISSKVTE